MRAFSSSRFETSRIESSQNALGGMLCRMWKTLREENELRLKLRDFKLRREYVHHFFFYYVE